MATPDCTHEEWQPVVGYEGAYSVSNLGRVRSEARFSIDRTIPERIMRLHTNPLGYVQVMLRRDGKPRCCKVHQLVAAAFIGPRPDSMFPHHRDANPSNNCVENLEYVTHSQNALYAVESGRKPTGNRHHARSRPEVMARGSAHGNAKLTEDDIREIRTLIGTMPQNDIAAKFGVHPVLITRVKRGLIWQHVT